jgi:hypothetical protein
MFFIPIVFCPLSASDAFEHCQDTILAEAGFQQWMNVLLVLGVDDIESLTIKTANLKSTAHKFPNHPNC